MSNDRNDIVAMALEEVARTCIDQGISSNVLLGHELMLRAKALRSTPSQAAGGLEMFTVVPAPFDPCADRPDYEPIPEAVAVIEAARHIYVKINSDAEDWDALGAALRALDKRLNPKGEP